jgi:two-component system chemotaxis response regulator CheY
MTSKDPIRTQKTARVLVIGWKANSHQFLRSVLSTLGRPAFTRAANTNEGLALLREQGFELVICTDDAEPLSAGPFTRALRRDQFSRQPAIPVVVISSGATAKEVFDLRAAGIDDVMCPPMSAEAIEKRLDRLLMQSRRFVVCSAFVGPERRRPLDRQFEGANRRHEAVSFYSLPPVLHSYRAPPVIQGESQQPARTQEAGDPTQNVYICDS